MDTSKRSFATLLRVIIGMVIGLTVLGGLLLSRLYSYLLFHSLSELFSIVVGFGIFIIAWNSDSLSKNSYLTVLGIGSLFIAGIDLIHTLAFKGMGIFTTDSNVANLPTQLWLAARYLQALTFLLAALVLHRRIGSIFTLVSYLLITGMLLVSIFLNIFPAAYVEGSGLTSFKIFSEYVIIGFLALSGFLLWLHHEDFDREVLGWMGISIFSSIVSELAFTQYIGVNDVANMLGHLFKIVAFYAIYRAVVETAFVRPYKLIFREIKQSETESREARVEALALMQDSVAARRQTEEINERLQQEITERRRAEEQIERSNRKLNEILTSIQDDFYVLDRDWNFVYASRLFTSKIGKEPEDFVGKNIWEMFPKHIGTVLEENFRTAMEKRQVRRFEIGGKYTTAWYRMTAFPSADGITVLGTDITKRKRAEQALHRQAMLLDLSSEAIFTWEFDGTILSWNKGAEQLYGYSSAEAIGQVSHQLLKTEHPLTFNTIMAKLSQEKTWTGELGHTTRDGRKIIVESRHQLIQDESGRSIVLEINRNITERKRAEDVLQQKEVELKEAQRIAHFGSWYWDAKTDVTTGSDELLRIYGFDPATQTMPDFKEQRGRCYPVEDWERVNAAVQKTVETGVGYELDVQALRNESAIWVTTRGEVVRGVEGQVVALRGTVQDITERKRAEEVLAFQARLLSEVQEAVFSSDRNFTINYWNQAAERMFGWTKEETLDKNSGELLKPIVESSSRDQERSKLWKDGHWEGEVQYIRKDGTYFFAEVNSTLLKDANGENTGNLIVARDITERKRAEVDLAWLASFPEKNPNPIVELDHSGEIIYLNQSCRKIFPDIASSGLNHPLLAGMEQLIQKLKVGELETFLTQDVKVRDAYYHQTIVHIPEGKVIRLYNVDITKRKQAENALRESEKKYTLLFEKAAIAASMTKLPENVFADVNEAFEKLFGYTKNEVIGKTSLELGIARPDEHSATVTEIQRKGFQYDTEKHVFTKSGEERIVLVNVNALEFDDKRYSLSTMQNITERKRAEEHIAYQARLLASVNDAIVGSDAQYRVNAWNASAESMYGWKAQEVLGRNGLEILRTEWSEKDADSMRSMIAETGRWRGEATQLRKDGTRMPVEVSSIVLHDENGQITGYVSVNRDISERKQTEETLARQAEDLRRSNAELEQFAYVASHDLQEPLRIMSSYSQLLERRYRGRLDQDADEFIDFIVEAAARMQKLITDLLAYSRAGRETTDPVEVDCNKIVRKLVSSMGATLESADACVTFDRLPSILARETSIFQLFQNLIGNALKFRGEQPPSIHVSARQGEGEWIFSVRDNGIGIEPQYHERIFMIFQRLHPREKYPGTGIGLSICKKIVENLGGRIWVESEAGPGSTFNFTVPIRKEQRVALQAQKE